MTSTERADDRLEQVAGPARARMGDMTRAERSETDRAIHADEARGKPGGEHVQEDSRDVPDTFTS
ncbi:general stress protein CsbD [Micromonospora mirobrigensis]|uniref:General stress protein CsbD n=1 Tax=Micromonospora mirobrigensis TaxID=262898 RepID=A0A1C4UXG7_9ACTN|nr:general stress protein CsbD [Micromonospora mirobrigensis]SCE76332.1 hypothetical protein GA0070564_101786 [Micromonospora mirobrigensis]